MFNPISHNAEEGWHESSLKGLLCEEMSDICTVKKSMTAINSSSSRSLDEFQGELESLTHCHSNSQAIYLTPTTPKLKITEKT